MEFAEGAVDVTVDYKEISRFPGNVGRGGFGLQGAVQSGSLSRSVAGHLIGAGQIKPIVGIVRIAGNGGAKIFDGGLRIAGDKCKVASKPVAIIRVARREAHRELQFGQLRTRGKETGGKLFSD